MKIFRQLFDEESHTYTYLLGDRQTGLAALIDPVAEKIDRDLNLLKELELSLAYVLETHMHADHVTSSGELRCRTGAAAIASRQAGVKCADRLVGEGDEIKVGEQVIRVLETPGHTSGCVSYWAGDRVFTGDALCIRTAGRTDFQGGSAKTLYHSIKNKLYALNDETLVYPAHDYQGYTCSTIGEEKRFNRRLPGTASEAEFCKLMDGLRLPEPKKIHTALPANLACGQLGAAK